MKKILSAIILIGLISVSIFISYSNAFSSKGDPIAEEGKLDLSSWDFSKKGAINLNGQWELYDNQLLTPEDFLGNGINKPNLTGYMNITSSVLDDKNLKLINAEGVRTYRLVIDIKQSDNIYGLKVDNIKMSNRIYVNGILRGSSGNAAEKSKGYYAGILPYDTYFNIQGSKAEIIIQVASYGYPFRGNMYRIGFGLQKDISFMTMVNSSIELGGVIITFLIAIYSLSIYSARKGDKIYLYFGIYFLIFMMMLLLNSQKIFLQFFTRTPFELFIKAQQISIVLSIIALIGITNEVDKKILSQSISKAIRILNIVYILIVLITTYPVYMYIKPFSDILITAFLVFLILRLIISIKKNNYEALDEKEAVIFLGIIICIFICYGINLLYSYCLVHRILIGSIGLCGFVILSAVFLSNRFLAAYKNMEKMSKELIKMDKVKDEFITKTSYELKAPLYGIINVAETIIKENCDNLNEKNIRDIMITKNIALRLTSIINDTLDVTLLKNGQLKINMALVDIKVCTNMIIESSKYIIQNKNIEIINDIKESLIVNADENRVRQILFNLINNSIENMEKGIIRISCNKNDDMVFISVEDSGRGIPKDDQEKIFKLYESLNSEGIGLGLYITRQLVELMGGEIYLDWSEINKGSLFVFSLPLSKEKINSHEVINENDKKYFDAAYSVNYIETEEVKKHKNTILIVDDEVFNIQTAFNIFTREGYNVLTAFSGEEALKKINEDKVDLVLLDVMMPGMSGIEVCRKFREKHSVIELPILISTLGNINYDLFLGFEAGANDFITKPFEEKELISRVRTLITLKAFMEDALKSELAFLQAQIKPHFLYNAISTIISFCYTDSEKAAELLTNFSKYLRSTFDIDNKSMLISLRQELEMVQAYVEIEKARFGEKIKVEYDIEEELMYKKIPSLVIQPLVENAIKHGLYEKNEGGIVHISVRKKDDAICIVVKDTGIGMSEEKAKSLEKNESKNIGVGLSNVIKRIKRLSKADIDIYSIEGEGTTVTISIKRL